jgi:hypothetical protein
MASIQMSVQTRQKVKDEITKILIRQAKIKKTIYYGEICRKIKNFKLMPNDEQLPQILGDISAASYRANKGLLSVFAVKKESGMPGDGFFTMAKKLGCRIITEEQFFKDQIDFVHNRYRDPKTLTI